MRRRAVYQDLAKRLGLEEYHTAEIRSVEQARAVYQEIVKVRESLGLGCEAV